MKFFIFFYLFIQILWAKEINYHFVDYNEAKKSSNFLKFESESTKLGLVTTSFDGYAKKFKIIYERKNNQITKLQVIVDANSLDTDNDSRNEKMFGKCLESNKYHQITYDLTKPIGLNKTEAQAEGLLKIRGKKLNTPLNLSIVKAQQKYTVSGSAKFSLTQFEIPDPSISIASVKDEFDLFFKIELE